MKLFTKELDSKLFANYSKGSDMDNQMVVGKIFNPYGRGTWYLMNSDPQDPDYLWGIVDLFEVEMGSFSRSELESVKVPPFNLGLERDMYFTPIKASELFQGLQEGKQYAKGGSLYKSGRVKEIEVGQIFDLPNGEKIEIERLFIDNIDEDWVEYKRNGKSNENSVKQLKGFLNNFGAKLVNEGMYEQGGELDNKDLVANKATEIAHHAKELHETLEHSEDVPAWVVSKIQRSATDIADVAHYLEGEEKEFGMGGELSGKYVKIHYAGVREPEVEKIERISITPAHYSHREVAIHHKDGSVSKFPLSKLEAFESGEQVEIKGGKEPYAIELVKDVMAKGGKLKVNRKYAYFALGKSDNKIVNGWEIVDDVESLKYYAKGDLKDMDLDPKDFSILSKQQLLKKGINPFDWESWRKTEYGKGGQTFASKTKAVAKRLQGEKVPNEYQGAYGKKYSPKEAREAAQRIIGAQVAKSKMDKGGETGYSSKKKLNEDFKRIIQAPKSLNEFEKSKESLLGKTVVIKSPNEHKSFRTKVSGEYSTMIKGSGTHSKLYEKEFIVSVL